MVGRDDILNGFREETEFAQNVNETVVDNVHTHFDSLSSCKVVLIQSFRDVTAQVGFLHAFFIFFLFVFLVNVLTLKFGKSVQETRILPYSCRNNLIDILVSEVWHLNSIFRAFFTNPISILLEPDRACGLIAIIITNLFPARLDASLLRAVRILAVVLNTIIIPLCLEPINTIIRLLPIEIKVLKIIL